MTDPSAEAILSDDGTWKVFVIADGAKTPERAREIAGELLDAADEAEGRHYEIGTGGVLRTHSRAECLMADRCVIHNPSDHAMRDFPTHWRGDRALMERICPHGVGHPDPDDLAFKRESAGREMGEALENWQEYGFETREAALMYGNHLVANAAAEGVHGCDGCCAGAYDAP